MGVSVTTKCGPAWKEEKEKCLGDGTVVLYLGFPNREVECTTHQNREMELTAHWNREVGCTDHWNREVWWPAHRNRKVELTVACHRAIHTKMLS